MLVVARRDRERFLAKDTGFENLKKSFTVDLGEKVKVLRTAVGDFDSSSKGCDWETVGRIAHQIRGTAKSFGFSEISTTADELEQFAAKRSLEQTVRLVRRISDLSRII